MTPIARLLSLPFVAVLVLTLTLLPTGDTTSRAEEGTPTPLPTITVSAPAGPSMTPPTPPPGTFIGPGQINPPGQPLCQAQSAYAGGQSIDALNLRITLPANGSYNVNFGISDPGGEFVRVCYVEGDAAVFFGRDGRETVRRHSGTASPAVANPVLDEIARGVSLTSPAPTPMPLCPSGAPGNRRVGTINGITVELPPGDYAVLVSPPGSPNPTFGVCYVQGNAQVTLSGITCTEVSRIDGTASAKDVLDAIVRSCTLAVTPLPIVPPSSSSGDAPVRIPIRPPDTGDAGLALR